MKKRTSIIIISVATVIIVVFGLWISASNKEIRLRSRIEAQKQVCEAFYDKLWKIISQKTQVAQQYKESFKDIYPQLIEGRYGNEKGGTLMKWITESNPTFDVSLYRDLSQSIEAERTGFFMEQEELVDLANEHRILLNSFPSALFLMSRNKVDITVVSSPKTKQVMESGEETDIELFKK